MEAKARSRGTVLRSRLAWCCDCDRCEGEIAISTKARLRSAQCCDDQTRFNREREIEKERDRQRELRTRQRDLVAAFGVGARL